ncbi:50S ribosomal protein L34e [Candidatus Woesearchaeota archaeon]|nr:50S ribosomal protein L34e [Candidatus Woesearchaeota archaeon]
MRPSKQKSRTLRRVFKKTPGGRTIVAYVKRKPKKLYCSNCGKELMGMKQLRPYKMASTPKTEKRPERPYGGVLCSRCTRRRIIESARMNA